MRLGESKLMKSEESKVIELAYLDELNLESKGFFFFSGMNWEKEELLGKEKVKEQSFGRN